MRIRVEGVRWFWGSVRVLNGFLLEVLRVVGLC